MADEPNQIAEMLACIKLRGPISAAKIEQDTGWNRQSVDVVIQILLDAGVIAEVGKAPWGEPTYSPCSGEEKTT